LSDERRLTRRLTGVTGMNRSTFGGQASVAVAMECNPTFEEVGVAAPIPPPVRVYKIGKLNRASAMHPARTQIVVTDISRARPDLKVNVPGEPNHQRKLFM